MPAKRNEQEDLTPADLVLGALQREHTRLSRIAEKAKIEADEYLEIGPESIAVYRELGEVITSRSHGPQVLKRLADLKKRQARVDRIRKKDLLTLLDRQHDAEWQRDMMAREVSNHQFRMSLYSSHDFRPGVSEQERS